MNHPQKVPGWLPIPPLTPPHFAVIRPRLRAHPLPLPFAALLDLELYPPPPRAKTEPNASINSPRWPPVEAYENVLVAEADQAAEADPAHRGRLIKSGAEFLEGFTPPDYLVDGLLQRQFVYTITAQTGSGKTAVSLLLAYLVGSGSSLAGREVQQGRVLYFAGENPDDVRMRWIAMAEHMGFDPATLPVFFVDGRQDLDAIEAQVCAEVEALGGVALVVFDTRAAFFHGNELNSNVEVGDEARGYRRFTTLPGGPTVLVPSHPVKNAGPDNLVPLGGGAFLNEVDGNLTLARGDAGLVMHWQGKFRGPGFEPIAFELQTVTADRLRDSKGRLIPTVLAREMTAEAAMVRASRKRVREPRRSKYADAFCDAVDDAVRAHGVPRRIMGNGPKMRCVRVEDVRQPFYRRCVTGQDNQEQSDDTRRKTFGRMVQNARDLGHGTETDASGTEWLWFVSPSSGQRDK